MESSQHARLLGLVVALWLLNALQHIPSFYFEHTEGDERVYLCLAREMHWNLANCTTKHDPLIRTFPSPIYRSDLFHHPPLYPLVLKIGMLYGATVVTGLVFSNLMMGLTFFLAWRRMLQDKVDVHWASIAFVGLAFCPLLLFSTARLHHDGLLGLMLACAVIVYIEALGKRSKVHAMIAGFLFVAAMNTRFSALAALPLVPMLQLFALHRIHIVSQTAQVNRKRISFWQHASQFENWIVFAIVTALVSTLGMQHYYRMLATCGTLAPSTISATPGSAAGFSQFLHIVAHRSRIEMIAWLLCVFPFLVVFFTPWSYQIIVRDLRAGRWRSMLLVVFLYLLGACFVFTHRQMRYFSMATPFLYLGLPYLFQQTAKEFRMVLLSVAALTFLLMITTGFLNAALNPPNAMLVVPSLFYCLPALRHLLL